ncbi:MAG: serine protease [Actinomycetota bacterium]|nr:serine protease [Actinomycetota bacterium]
MTTASAAGEVHPGVQTVTRGAQCTANFIFRDASATYVGQAAHCSGTGAATDTNGCTSRSLPIGTAVTVKGATRPGKLVYNSWIAMQGKGENDPDTCAYNDLALVQLDPADMSRVDPSVPGFGGPTGVAEAPTNAGATVYTYGNSSLRGGVTKLSPKQGAVVHFMDASGNAIGVLSTVQIAPLAGSNGVGDLAREIAYMQANSAFTTTTTVVPGAKAFNPDLLSAIAGA